MRHGYRLFSELESLRELHERRELEKANRELQQRAEEGELLRQGIHHRVKNSLQIVSSVLHLQVPLSKIPSPRRRSATPKPVSWRSQRYTSDCIRTRMTFAR
jgi:light-regulated signal transduction histidine kinase (bacteriophytochrome)